jgi:hypothetical protein
MEHSVNYPLFNSALAARGITQRELSFEARVGEIKLSTAIHGRGPLTPDERQRIARVLRIEVAVLFPDHHGGGDA